MSERERLEQAVSSLEEQRETLGDAVVDASIAALREKLASLDTHPPTAQQRKQVTILFADVVGSTEMGEKLDPETVMDIMSGGLNLFGTAVEQERGLVAGLMGDGLMALFGAPAAGEDDPERAVRAGLAIIDAARNYRGEIAERFGVGGFSVRVGINTGLVALGQMGGPGGEYTAIGDATNLAARLTGAAPADGLLIAHDTYQHVRGLFNVQPLEPLRVKGKAEPVQAYLVRGAKARAFHIRRRGVEGIDTRMIGREAELKQLQDALYETMEDGEGHIITVHGDAGVGKSRLMSEFDSWVELLPEDVYYFKGRSSPEFQKTPYALIRDLFAFRFEILDSDSATTVRDKMQRGIDQATANNSQMRADFIAKLIGYDFGASPHLGGVLDDAKQIRNRALIYLRDYFKAITFIAPAVILLEDIHWADDGSLDTITYLSRTAKRHRLLIVCTARPTLFKRRPHFGEGEPHHMQLALNPLSKRNSRRLFQEITQRLDNVPDTLRDMVVERAEGNPFFIEELIKMLIEDGVIIKDDPGWRIESGRLTTMRIPSTLVGILQARLDGLPVTERCVLQRASVVGRRFWDSAVERIGTSAGEGASRKNVLDSLSTLRGNEMIFRREPSTFAGTQEYGFKHTILREVTYESVLKRDRRTYHAVVADWLVDQSGERVSEFFGVIADHLELASRRDEARLYLLGAARRAKDQYANAEAIGYLTRALELTPDSDPAELFELHKARERLRDLVGDRQAQIQDLARMQELAVALGDDALRAEASLRRARHSAKSGDYPAAIAQAQEAIALAQAAGSVAREADGQQQWASALVRQSKFEEARAHLEQALSLAREAGAHSVESACLLHLGIAAYNQGDYARAGVHYQECLRLSRSINHPTNESAALVNLGAIARQKGDNDGAMAFYREALERKREIGNRHGEALTLGNLANVALDQGDYGTATADLEQSLEICRDIGEPYGESNALCNLGSVAREQGDYDGARSYCEESLALYRKAGDRYGESHALLVRAMILYQVGDYEAAMRDCEQALLIARDLALRSVEADAQTILGHALVSLDRVVDAGEYYRRAVSLHREIGEESLALDPLAGLAGIALKEGELTEAVSIVDEILRQTIGGELKGDGSIFRVYWICYRVLRAADDPRADEVLRAAHRQLEARARSIRDDALRRSYLDGVVTHREIMKEARARRMTDESKRRGRPIV